jgi:hypothetical protein
MFRKHYGQWEMGYSLFAILICGASVLFVPKTYWTDCFLIAMVVGVLFPILVRLSALRLYRKVSEEWGKISFSLREDGLEISHAGARTLYFWSYIHEIRKMREMIALGAMDNSWLAITMGSAQNEVVPIPFSAFANDAERQTFVDAVKAGIGKAKQSEVELPS